MRDSIKIKDEFRLALFVLPSFIGLMIFYLVPFIVSINYATIDNPVAKNFVGLQNFIETLTSGAFRLAFKNTVIFMLICVPLNVIVSLFIALLLNKCKKYKNVFGLFFLLPLVIPSASIVYFWQTIFGINGVLNQLITSQNPTNWLETSFSRAIITFIFLWKNLGFNIILFVAGINFIPKEYYENAKMDGAGTVKTFTNITIVYLIPTTFLVFMMSVINSFKSFKEVFLLVGSYPHESIYMLQHYMNNQFFAQNYQKLASGSYILSVLIVIMVFFFFRFQRKFNDSIQ